MSTIHIRVAVTDNEFKYLVQVSTDNLIWFTVQKFKHPDPAMSAAKMLEDGLKVEWKNKVTHVLWRTKS